MLFRCQICSRVVPPGTRAQRVVCETRDKVYPFRIKVNRYVMKNGKISRDRDQIPIGLDDPGGRGEEIVREALACLECAADPSAADRERRDPSPSSASLPSPAIGLTA